MKTFDVIVKAEQMYRFNAQTEEIATQKAIRFFKEEILDGDISIKIKEVKW